MTETAADVSAPRVFEAELHLTTSDYREGVWKFPFIRALRWMVVIVVVAATVLTIINIESTETEYLVPTVWLPLIVLSFAFGFVPDLIAWRMSRTSPFREGATVRLDAEQIAYTAQQTSLSYRWPLVRKAVETRAAFHLVAGTGPSTAVCILPKRMFPLEDQAALRDLITSKVGRLRRR